MKYTRIILIITLIIIGFSMRLLPHPPNFTPISALALFSAFYLPHRLSWIIPFSAMILSDALIGFYSWQIMLSVYMSFALVIGIGLLIKNNKKFTIILSGTILGSILFYLITNAAVWIFGTMYTHNFSGLLQSYYMALPFFRNSLMGDLFYTSIFIGIAESTIYMYTKIKNNSLTHNI